ncbi:MAG: hypothetical protein DME23_11030 [Verrucomicrobia bacterium]|nr:MAG: hypothetical protein DME23_11030 [Verrucomicrobiota bacterium]
MPCHIASNGDKLVASFCRILKVLRTRLASLAQWRRGCVITFSPADEGETTARNSPWSDVR